MPKQAQPTAEAIWVRPHRDRKGRWVRGHWRTPPRVVNVRGHLRELSYVQPHKRRRPSHPVQVPVIFAGHPESIEHALINILKDVEPLMGY